MRQVNLPRTCLVALFTCGLLPMATASADVTVPQFTFTGPSTFSGPPTISPSTSHNGGVPHFGVSDSPNPPLGLTDLPNGFSVQGGLDFTNAPVNPPSSVTITYSASRPFTGKGIPLTTTTSFDGLFEGAADQSVHLSYSVQTTVSPSGGATISQGGVSALGEPIVGSLHVIDGPVSSNSFLASRPLILTQIGMFTISGAAPSQEVHILLPAISTLNVSAVPEPASMLLFGLGALGMGVYLRRQLQT